MVELLAHPNGWHRDTAARLLHQRQEKAAVPGLLALAGKAANPATRILALHVLRGLDALDAITLQQALKDADSDVRANAVGLCALVEANADLVASLAADPSPRVRVEVAWALVTLIPTGKPDAVATLLDRADAPWLQHSALAAAGADLDPVLMKLGERNPARLAELRQLLGGKAVTAAVLPAMPSATPRAEAVAKYAPALTLAGDAGKGRATFETRCAICHRFGKLGASVGPDLDASRTAGREKLLGNILEPSREITAGYGLGLVETKAGETLSGILSNETPAGVTLRLPGGAECIVRRSEIAKVERPANSLMPDGLEAGLSPEEMADLLAFLTAPATAKSAE